MADLNLKPSKPAARQSRPILSSSLLKPWIFDYAPSPDGNDLNLLILLHGLGDTKQSFADLAKKLNLPSTATLALQAPDPLPLLEHPAYSWYNTFTPFFETLPDPNPRTILPPLRTLIETLVSPEIGWDLQAIHLFGFGQGGTTALELALDIGREGVGPSKSTRFGSTTSICASLLSPITSELHLQTPICTFSRQDSRSAQAQKYQKRLEAAFDHVEVLSGQKGPDAMPKNREEWRGVMKFWGEVLLKAEGWRGGGEVYEIMR